MRLYPHLVTIRVMKSQARISWPCGMSFIREFVEFYINFRAALGNIDTKFFSLVTANNLVLNDESIINLPFLVSPIDSKYCQFEGDGYGFW